MTYKTYLFDADNTLYDYNKAEEYALRSMFQSCGFTFSEAVHKKYQEINEAMWRAYEKGEVKIDQFPAMRFAHLFEAIGVTHDAASFNTNYLAWLGKGSFLIEGAEEICQKITAAGGEIYIVTNGLLATQESRIKHSLIRQYISGSFVSSNVGYQKPDPRYFSHVFANIPGLEKAKTIIIGDNITADIYGGNNAGIDSCWFNPSVTPNQTKIKPTYEISRLVEVLRFL
ncbi:MAG: YjjG family noncanonical pyrimidine nucleotidase [Defluviitaleaceae bacterium]|nr:YjjG family noncanonical pyrimidine nucleotidase [Defluviitaleaceae bacterium]